MPYFLNAEKHTPLISPKALLQDFPLSQSETFFIHQSIQAIQNILSHKDPRLLVILGPCSIHNTSEAVEYALKLKELQSKVASHLFLVMRVYVEKPRTLLGWKGLLHDPDLNGTNQMNEGLIKSRKLLLDLARLHVPAAMEFLELMSANYLADLISWGCIGARTAASQPHRQIASLLPMPVGFKNGVDGNIQIAIEGAKSAQLPHAFMHIDSEGRIAQVHSKGNSYSHIVLRGGNSNSNYGISFVEEALSLLEKNNLSARLLIDCAHGNSRKKHTLQKDAFSSILEQIHMGKTGIMGFMLESNLLPGSQGHRDNPHKGISITDPCIGWEETEELILEAHSMLESEELFIQI